MDFIKKYWDMAEGKLAFIKHPGLRFATLAIIVLVALYILSSILPLIVAMVIGIGVILVLFKMFTDVDEDDKKP